MCKVLEEEISLDPDIEQLLQELGLELLAEELAKFMANLTNVEDITPKGEKIQHFLHSLIHLHRLREWMKKETGDDEQVNERDGRREKLRKMLVVRGDKATGYAGDWLNAVPCEALGTRLNRAVFLVVLNWWLGGRMPLAQTCGVRTASGRSCEQKLDKWGDHAVNCKVGPGVIARHNGVNLAWMSFYLIMISLILWYRRRPAYELVVLDEQETQS